MRRPSYPDPPHERDGGKGEHSASEVPPETAVALPAGVIGLLTLAQAAAYLGVSIRHLQDRVDIPRVDVSAPGAGKPAWRYRLHDLEHFALSRTVNPYVKRAGAT